MKNPITRKVSFSYTKDDGSISNREILEPKFLKESFNLYNDFEKENVKYIQGFEIKKEGLTEEENKKYEEVLRDYFDLTIPTMEEFFKENLLDYGRIQQKSFKKEKITNFNIIL